MQGDDGQQAGRGTTGRATRRQACDDRRLVEEVRAGEAEAFEAIVHRYSPQLARHCRHLGLSDDKAADVLQQSFLKAWVALDAGAEVRELKPWLFAIVHNAAASALRDARELPLEESHAELEARDGRSDLDHLLTVRAALAAMAALPAAQREALLLSALGGHPRSEVAATLGMTETAVRGLLYRARATLRSAVPAIMPAPASWALGALRKGAHSTARALEGVTPAGVQATGLASKGAALALTTAAVVTGVAAFPHSADRAHRERLTSAVPAGRGPHGLQRAAARSSLPRTRPVKTPLAARWTPPASTATTTAAAQPPATRTLRPASGTATQPATGTTQPSGAPSTGGSSVTASASVPATIASSTTTGAPAPTTSTGSSATASEPPATSTNPTPSEPKGSGGESGDGGQEAGNEAHEHESGDGGESQEPEAHERSDDGSSGAHDGEGNDDGREAPGSNDGHSDS